MVKPLRPAELTCVFLTRLQHVRVKAGSRQVYQAGGQHVRVGRPKAVATSARRWSGRRPESSRCSADILTSVAAAARDIRPAPSAAPLAWSAGQKAAIHSWLWATSSGAKNRVELKAGALPSSVCHRKACAGVQHGWIQGGLETCSHAGMWGRSLGMKRRACGSSAARGAGRRLSKPPPPSAVRCALCAHIFTHTHLYGSPLKLLDPLVCLFIVVLKLGIVGVLNHPPLHRCQDRVQLCALAAGVKH